MVISYDDVVNSDIVVVNLVTDEVVDVLLLF